MTDDRRADGSCNHRYCTPIRKRGNVSKVRCDTCKAALTVRTLTAKGGSK